MNFLFGQKVSVEEVQRKNQRALNQAIRDLEREKAHMQRQEQQIIVQMKVLAKEGQYEALKLTAKDLIQTRRYARKFQVIKAQLQAVSLKLQTVKSLTVMTNTIYNVTRAMFSMNKKIDLPQLKKILVNFEIQSEIMDLKQETIDNSMDELEETVSDEESDAVYVRVLEELGLQMNDQLVQLPQVFFKTLLSIENKYFTFFVSSDK